MKKAIYTISVLAVLTGFTLLCIFRWNAWFYNPPEPAWQSDTIDFKFNTFGQKEVYGFEKEGEVFTDIKSPDTLCFAVIGDVHNSMTRDDWEYIYSEHPQIDFYAQVGDFMERGYFYYYQLLVSKIAGTGFECLPIIAVPGNHEYRKGVIRKLPKEWNEWFINPENGPKRFAGTSYYVDFENLRFIAIDTNGLHSISDYTIVLTWLNDCLKDAGERFTVVMMHHPVYSNAVGRQNIAVRTAFRHALEKADIVFSGHDHNYTRRLPFISVNSAEKYYLSKVSDKDERICSGEKMYEIVYVTDNSMSVETYILGSGKKYDEIKVKRLYGGEKTYSCDSTLLTKEIIKLPKKYEGKENSGRVKKFVERRERRMNKLSETK